MPRRSGLTCHAVQNPCHPGSKPLAVWPEQRPEPKQDESSPQGSVVGNVHILPQSMLGKRGHSRLILDHGPRAHGSVDTLGRGPEKPTATSKEPRAWCRTGPVPKETHCGRSTEGGQSRSWGCGCSAVCWGRQGRAGVTEASMDSGSGTREWGEASRVDREGAAGLLLVTAVC